MPTGHQTAKGVNGTNLINVSKKQNISDTHVDVIGTADWQTGRLAKHVDPPSKWDFIQLVTENDLRV